MNFKILKNQLEKSLKTQYSQVILSTRLQFFLESELMTYSNFSITDDALTIYFNPSFLSKQSVGILSISIPLSEFETDFSFLKQEEQSVIFKVQKEEHIIDPNQKVIAFTFDDGPSEWAEDVLDLFKDYQGSTTFFVIGNKIDYYQSVLKRMIQGGHEIGNHFYNHQWMSCMNEQKFKEQIQKTQDKIFEITGYLPQRLRPTYGELNKKLENMTYLDIVLWTIDPKD